MGSNDVNIKAKYQFKGYSMIYFKKIIENIHILFINIVIAVFAAILITRFILSNGDYWLSLFVGLIIGLFNTYRIISIKNKKNISS